MQEPVFAEHLDPREENDMQLYASMPALSEADCVSASCTQSSAEIDIHREALFVPGPEGARFARGVITAVGLEAVAGFCIYACWQAFHLMK